MVDRDNGYKRRASTPCRRWACLCGFIAVAAMLFLPGETVGSNPAAGNAKDTSVLFAKAVRREGASYVVARNVLIRRSKAIVPFLKTKIRSDDCRERNLAEVMLLRIEQPEKVTQWLHIFNGYDHGLDFRADGTVLVKFDPAEAAWARQHGKTPPPMDDIVVDCRIVPFILDIMREGGIRSSGGIAERRFKRCLQFLHHFADPRSINTLMHAVGKVWQQDPIIAETLVKIGKPALPALRKATRKGNGSWYDTRRAVLAVQVLGKLDDSESVPMLIETLDKLTSPDTIAAYCQTLAKFGTRKCADAVFAQLLNCAKGWPRWKDYHDSKNYFAIREAMLSFGDTAKSLLKNVVKTGNDTIARAISRGMLWELTNPEKAKASYAAFGRNLPPRHLYWSISSDREQEIDFADVGRKQFWRGYDESVDSQPIPAELLIERAAARPSPGNLTVLGRLKGNDLAFDVLAAAILKRKNPYHRAILALAEMGNPKAVDVYSRILPKQSIYYADTIAEALLLLNEPAGAKVLREIINREVNAQYYKEVKYHKENIVPLAEAVLSALEGKPEPVVKLLESKQQSLRLTAARYFARKGDVRAVPVLLAEASADKVGLHISLRGQIVAMGKVALEPLEKIQADTKDEKKRLLCEAIRLRITNLKLARTLERAYQVPDPGFGSCGGPDVGDYRAAGKRIAKAIGPKAVPLLEAEVVWEHGGIAAFALAEFKQQRSIDLLVKYCGNVGWAKGKSIAAHALKEFGPAGIAAAKKVPAADPNKARFDRRVRRHRTAAGALALAEDPKGVEEIIKGLKLATDDKIGPSQTRVYMHLAGKYTDKRLIEPLIQALEKQEHKDTRDNLANLALKSLCRYKDDRIVPPCLKHLAHKSPTGYPYALIGLARVKGNGLAAFLVEQAGKSKDEDFRIRASWAMSELVSDRNDIFPKNKDEDAPKLSKDALAKEKTLLYQAMMGMLDDPSESVQRAAADDLSDVSYRRGNKTGKAALIAWADRQEALSPKVVKYLAWTKDTNVGPLLLKIFRKNPSKSYDAAKTLSGLHYEKAIPDVAAELRRFIAKDKVRWGIPLMDVLGGFGKSGCKEVYDIMRQNRELIVQCGAAAVLSQYRYEKGFAETQRLFEELIAAGPDDARVKRWYWRGRLESYQAITYSLSRSLWTWDAKKAYPIILKASLETTDKYLGGRLSKIILNMERRNPKLKGAK